MTKIDSLSLVFMLMMLCAPVFAIDAGYTSAYASPNKRIGMYTIDASPNYSPDQLPRPVYVFRKTSSIDSDVVSGQNDIIVDGGDIRQYVIVVVPSGSISTPLLTESDVLSSSYEVVTLGNKYCHCPLTPSNFTYASDLDRQLYPAKSALFANGSVTNYINFGDVTSYAAAEMYELRDVDDTLLSYLIDSVPGDTAYTTMRKLIRVTVPNLITNVAELSGLAQIDSGLYVSAAVVFVKGADMDPENIQRQSGYYADGSVTFYEFNSSRLTTSMVSESGIVAAKLFQVEGQAIPVVDVAPGDAGYSDLWSIFDVPKSAVVSSPANSAMRFDASKAVYRGQYLNCPMVHENATLSDDTVPKQQLYYKGETRLCFKFPSPPALNCKLRDAYELRRSGNGEVVDGNDLFTAAPSDELTYSPLSWVLPLSVTQQYPSGNYRSVLNFPGRNDVQRSLGYFSNRPIVDEASVTGATRTYTHSVVLHAIEYSKVTLEWALRGVDTLDVRLTAKHTGGFIAVGFGGTMGSAHSGYHLVVYRTTQGQICSKQFHTADAAPQTLQELDGNPINVTGLTYKLSQGFATLSFSRNIVGSEVTGVNTTLIVNDLTRVSFAVGRNAPMQCSADVNTFVHDSATGERSILWNQELTTSAPLTSAPPIFWPEQTPAPTAPVTAAPTSGNGSYKCDHIMSFSWTIDATTQEIEFLITTAPAFEGWVGIGWGRDEMNTADIYTMFKHPGGEIILDDRKGIDSRTRVPPRDKHQDGELVGTNEFRFKRKLDTKDRLSSAQPIPFNTLSPRSYMHQSGWAGGVKVAYYNIDNQPTFGGANTTSTATMYLMRNASGGSLTFQRDIVDVLPGQSGYSDLWNLRSVTVPSDFIGPEIRYAQDIPSSWMQSDTGTRLNCPIVSDFSTIDLTSAIAAVRPLWYRGLQMQCIAFGSGNPDSTMTQNVYFMRSTSTNDTLDAVFQYHLLDSSFTAFGWIHYVAVPPGYVPGSYTTEEQVLQSPFTVEKQNLHMNLPMVPLSDVQDPTATNTPAPPVLDATLLNSYERRKTLYEDTQNNEKIVLYWNYISSRRVLQVMMIGYALNGYVAIGFSNTTSVDMQYSDIVLGFVNSRTQEGCIRRMYADADKTSAPSRTPTMRISAETIQTTAGATILRFEREFDSGAHYAGLIPTIAQGATSRVIYATRRGYLDTNCTGESYSPFYHDTSPHGSVTVNWMETESQAPDTPVPTPAPPVVLTKQTLSTTTLMFRKTQLSAYCMEETTTLAVDEKEVRTPVMYRFVRNSTVAVQRSVVDEFPRTSPLYSGAWEVRTVFLPSSVSVEVTQSSSVQTLALVEVADRYKITCPIVHPETTVQPTDVAEFPTEALYYKGQQIGCINMGTMSSPEVTPQWNTTTASVVDELAPRLWRLVDVAIPSGSTTQYNTPETFAALTMTESTTVRACALLKDQPNLMGDVNIPSVPSYSLQTGYFNDREVRYFAVESAQRFSSRDETWTHPMYIIREGTSLSAAPLQNEAIVGVAPGNKTYSDIWQIIVVDGTGKNDTYDSVDSISALPQYPTNVYLNCPVMSDTVVFNDAVVSMESLRYEGQNLSCANFGYVKKPSELPTLYEVRRSSNTALPGRVFSAAPGTEDFYPLQWMKSAQLASDSTNAVTSVETLKAMNPHETTLFNVWNVFVVVVQQGNRASTMATVESINGRIRRTGYDALVASPVVRNLTQTPAATVPELPTVYVFRRGLTSDSEEIDTQRTVIVNAPGDVTYRATVGSSGYADTKWVAIVQIPRNYTGAEIRSEAMLTSMLSSGGGWAINRTTNLVMHSFVFVNTTATSEEVNCPAVTVWFNSNAMPSLDCGFSLYSRTASTEGIANMGSLVSRDEFGSSMFTDVPLSPENPYIVNAFKPQPVSAWVNNFKVTAYKLSLPDTVPTISRKYIFRNGPSIFSNAGADVIVPVLDTVQQTGHPMIVRVYVVDVSGSSQLPDRVAGIDELLQLAEANCWPIHATEVYEAGVLIAQQTSVPAMEGVSTITVWKDGARFKHVISSLLNEPELSDESTYIVAIYPSSSATTPSRYIYPTADGVLHNSLRRVKKFVTTESLTSAPAESALTNTTDVLVLHASFIGTRPHVKEPIQQNYQRQVGWYEERRVFYYAFENHTLTSAAAAVPTPFYNFRKLNNAGTIQSSRIGTPLLITLPGHSDYNDLHAMYNVDVYSTYNGQLPQNEHELMLAISRGSMKSPQFTGEVRLMPVVNTLTTIDVRDYYDGSTNPYGVTKRPVIFEGESFEALDFGVVPNQFNSELSVALHIQNEAGTALSSNTAFLSAPGSTGYSPIMQTKIGVVPDSYVLDSAKNFSTVEAATLRITTSSIHTLAVVALDDPTSNMLYDDIPIAPGRMDAIWAYGAMNSDPLEILPHTAKGTAKINFFTGETNEATSGNSTLTSPNSIRFGSTFTLEWSLRKADEANTTSRRFEAMESITYAPAETEIVFKLTCYLDVWAGIGISTDGSMAGADIIVAYLTEYQPLGRVTLEEYFHFSDRKATTKTLPPVDASQDVRLIEKKKLDGTGYEMTFARKLVTGDVDGDLDIPDENIKLIWAYGEFDMTTGHPKQHSDQGNITVNLVSGNYPDVPQHPDSYWYIAALVGVMCGVMLLAMLLRILPPGSVLWRRIFKSKAAESMGWLTRMPLGEMFVLFVTLSMSAMWMVGNWQDMDRNRHSEPAWRCIGAGAQFYMYFYLWPTLRYNVILRVFRTHFHRVSYWANILGVLMALFAWIHGIGMMIAQSDKAFEWRGVSGLLGTIAMTIMVLVTSNTLPLPKRARHISYIVFMLLMFVFVFIHVPKTALGMIPTFLLILYDFGMRFKDRNSRFGHVRSFGTYGSNILALEIEAYSPWHKCRTRPFHALPGQFVYAHFANTDAPIPLMLSSRVMQDVESDWCTFTFHLKTPFEGGSIAKKLMAEAKQGTLDKRLVQLEGPHGELKLRLRFYHTAVLFAGGIGMTSVMSLLEQLVFDPDYFSRETQLQHLTVIWVVHSPEELLVFANELLEIHKAPKPFELDILLFASSLNNNPIPAEFTDVGNADESANLPKKYADLRNELPNHPLFAKQQVLRGRPVLPKIFADLKLAISKRLEFRSGVYVSAPESLATSVAGVCDELSNWKDFQFHVELETYSLR